MLDNCFRFAPRDSIPGLIAKICKYLKDHPGWSEAELENQIKQFIGQTGVDSFNGRNGAVVLNEDDVNNLKIASAYFAEGNETIDKLDLVSLYNQGVRFVFTDFNSVTSGYNLAFVLDYFDASGEVVYYPVSTGSGGGGNIVSVNGKTGEVHLKVVDVSSGNSPDENAYIFIDESDDYPDVISSDSSKLGGQLPSYYASAEDVSTLKSDLSYIGSELVKSIINDENVRINIDTWNSPGFISPTKGDIANNDDYSYTEYLYVFGGEKIYLYHTSQLLGAFYDVNKTFIGGINISTIGTTDEVIIPQNACYIRVSVETNKKNDTSIKYLKTDKAIDLCDKVVKTYTLNNELELELGTRVDGYFVGPSNGNINENSGYSYRDKTKCISGLRLRIEYEGEQVLGAFFTSDDGWCGRIQHVGGGSYVVEIPDNASYFKVSVPTANIDNLNVYYYKESFESTKIIKVGNGELYTKLIDGINEAMHYHNAIVYIGEGTYDLYNEFGADYFTTYDYNSTKDEGLKIGNGIHLIFSPKSKVVFNYTGDNESVQYYFSPFNADIGDFTIENLNLECSRCRYAIHDDNGYNTINYTHKYINCNIKCDNTNNSRWITAQCIGAGFGDEGLVIIDGCYFKSVPRADLIGGLFDCAVSYHSCGKEGAKGSRLILKNSYFDDTNTLRLGYYGSAENSNIYVSACSFGSEIIVTNEIKSATTNNLILKEWSNEIRQAN